MYSSYFLRQVFLKDKWVETAPEKTYTIDNRIYYYTTSGFPLLPLTLYGAPRLRGSPEMPVRNLRTMV